LIQFLHIGVIAKHMPCRIISGDIYIVLNYKQIRGLNKLFKEQMNTAIWKIFPAKVHFFLMRLHIIHLKINALTLESLKTIDKYS
jgi:hypothetical protein